MKTEEKVLWGGTCASSEARGVPYGVTAVRRSCPLAKNPTTTTYPDKLKHGGPGSERGCAYNRETTLNNGYLGSRNDEERSEMRYLM